MKKSKTLQLFLAITLSLTYGITFAYTTKQNPSGAYIGFQTGYGNINYSKEEKVYPFYVYSESVDSSGLAGRLYAGYDFNKYFALEAGITLLPKVTFHFPADDFGFNQNALDLLGKVTLPLQYNIDLYAKAGVADVIRANYTLDGTEYSDRYTDIVPAAGMGASYGFNENVFADLSYMHYFGKEDYFKPADFLGIGIVYKF